MGGGVAVYQYNNTLRARVNTQQRSAIILRRRTSESRRFEQKRHRSLVVDEHAHIGAEPSGGNGRVPCLRQRDEILVKLLRLEGRHGAIESGPAPAARVAVERELAHDE